MNWISVKNSLPAYEVRVLAYVMRYRGLPREILVAYRSNTDASGEHWIVDQGSCGAGIVLAEQLSPEPEASYWMPLPAPPK
jgi:hypothetical protein